MAELLTARDKIAQVEAQIRSAEMEYFVLGLRVGYAQEPLADDADDFEKAAHDILKQEADSCRAARIAWEHKLEVLRAAHEPLKVEVDKSQQ